MTEKYARAVPQIPLRRRRPSTTLTMDGRMLTRALLARLGECFLQDEDVSFWSFCAETWRWEEEGLKLKNDIIFISHRHLKCYIRISEQKPQPACAMAESQGEESHHCWPGSLIQVPPSVFPSYDQTKKGQVTLPKTNIAPEDRPSQKEIHLPTIHFQALC